MIAPLLLLLAAAPTPTPAPVSRAPRSLADIARERKLQPSSAGIFSASESRGTGYTGNEAYTQPRKVREVQTPAPELYVEDGEPYWRARADRMRQGVRDARHRLREAEITTPSAGSLRPDTAAAQLAQQIRDTALAPYRAALREAEGRLKAMESECSAAKQQGQFCADAWLR